MADLRDSNFTSPTPEKMLDTSAASPASPGSPGSSQASTPIDLYDPALSSDFPKRVPSLRSISDPNNANPMNPTSTPQGVLQHARIPLPQPQSGLSAEHLAKTRAFLQSRMGTSPNMSANSSPRQTPKSGPPLPAQIPNLQGGVPNLSNGFNPMKIPVRPVPGGALSAPAVPRAGLGARRGLNLSMGDNPVTSPVSPPSMNGMRLPAQPSQSQSNFSAFSKYIDTKHGYLTFDEARVFDKGVEFADGQMFSISLDEIEVLDELGKGNYGTVYKVKHAKPTLPRFGPGLTGFRQKHPRPPSFINGCPPTVSAAAPHLRQANGTTTGRVMAMKEIRLELDEQKFKNILKELIILHHCSSPYIIDFYGAFFQEGSVYMCIEYMDGGSLDKLYTGGIPEGVLKKIAYATVSGLLELKEKHQIIHRDVKPTNILANTSGQVKICDFGVSGNLVASKAMTNIGCQSYMAPERISGGALVGLETNDGSYDVTSDIWSLGLTIIECATGKYPYPPEVSSSILGQLNAIVQGDPPDLPSDGFSNTAREFVKSCLNKVPSKRPTYKNLLQHSWLASLSKPGTIAEVDEESGLANSVETMSITTSSMEAGDQEVADWVKNALAKSLEEKARHKGQPNGKTKPALHAAPLGL